MLHHLLPPLRDRTGRSVRPILEALATEPGIHIDFVTVSESHVYQSESIGDTVTIHRLNVYRQRGGPLSTDELFEYQTKSYIFILRTARKIQYDLIHALGIFPEAYTAYAFKNRFPYILSLLPSDRVVSARMMGGRSESLKSLGREFAERAWAVFDHSKMRLNPVETAKKFAAAYAKFARQRR